MKILLISDTHGHITNLDTALSYGPFDAVLHMGDAGRQEDEIRNICHPVPVDFVAGNCDIMCQAPSKLILTFENTRLVMVHGHELGVKRGLFALSELARDNDATIALFGHTHMPNVSYEPGGILCVNPGSLSSPRQPSGYPTFGILTISGNKAQAEIVEIK